MLLPLLSPGTIPAASSQDPDDLSISIEMYLSTDASLSADDSPLDVRLTSTQTAVLRSPITTSLPSPHMLQVPGQYLKLPILDHPENKMYCSHSYILVKVIDAKNQPSIDPNLANNVYAHPIHMTCTSDLLSIVSFAVATQPPQDIIYSGLDVTVHLELVIHNDGADVDASTPDRPNIHLRAYISDDLEFNPQLDSSVQIAVNSDEVRQKLHGAFPSGQQQDLSGPATIHIPLSACTSPYMLLFLHPGVALTTKDHVLENDMRYLDISSLIHCSSESVDLTVVSFSLPLGSLLQPGNEVDFHLRITVDVNGQRTIGGPGEPAILFYFYLSRDETWDDSDFRLQYSVYKQAAVLGTKFDVVTNVTLDSNGEQLTIPGDVPMEVCGNVYLLTVLDPGSAFQEMSEYNNVHTHPVLVSCQNGECLTHCLLVSHCTQWMYHPSCWHNTDIGFFSVQIYSS